MKSQITYTDYQKLSDEELLRRYSHRHDQVAASLLFERYGHLILGVSFKHQKKGPAARNATEQIFIKMLDGVQRFNIEKFKPWLFQFTNRFFSNNNNLSKNYHKSETFSPIILEELQTNQGKETLMRAFSELATEQKNCLELFYINKMTYREIGKQQGLSFREVKNALRDGINNLQSKFASLAKTEAA